MRENECEWEIERHIVCLCEEGSKRESTLDADRRSVCARECACKREGARALRLKDEGWVAAIDAAYDARARLHTHTHTHTSCSDRCGLRHGAQRLRPRREFRCECVVSKRAEGGLFLGIPRGHLQIDTHARFMHRFVNQGRHRRAPSTRSGTSRTAPPPFASASTSSRYACNSKP